MMKILKPPALKSGDKVGIIAPASNIQRELLDEGIAGLRKIGYGPIYLPGILERDLYFAGPVQRRVRELQELLERDDIAALICARGGYGTNYLLKQLDFEKFVQHPKIIVGYSDNTSLLTAITDRCGLVTFHGPMVTKDFALPDGVELSSWNNAVGGTASWNLPTDGVQVLRQGKARGRLYGGCLSLLVASLGTPFEIQTDETILFMEDIGAKPYQIDRMLMQLRLAGKLDKVNGFVFGEMLDCAQPGGQDYSLPDVILRVLQGYDVPIIYGLRSGHVSRANITLPIGVDAELIANASGPEFTILEPAVKIS
ncbi:MAG TPA: LD-carboxypeptidase [Candidatus Angelobacter sp.]|nr:LD-carboxypeptidase [Candidatus Angelobacter sp.]